MNYLSLDYYRMNVLDDFFNSLDYRMQWIHLLVENELENISINFLLTKNNSSNKTHLFQDLTSLNEK